MSDYSSTLNVFSGPIEELIQILKNNEIDSLRVKEFLDKYKGTEYIGEIQSVIDVKELLTLGLIP